jgi:hypothetical protein
MIFSAFAQISLWGVLAASGFGFVFGGVYFGALVPKYYAIALGREAMPATKLDILTILGPFACNVVMIVTTAAIMRMIGVVTLADALSLGLAVLLYDGERTLFPGQHVGDERRAHSVAVSPLFAREQPM